MSDYQEIEVEVFTNIRNSNKTTSYSFPKNVIQYYRQYVTSPEHGKGTIKTMLYLQGSDKGLVLDCGYDTFKRKLGSGAIDVSGLSSSEVEEVKALIQSFK